MKVKICGITDPADATYAASAGADYIGMIMTPGYKRSITSTLAKKISKAAKSGGAEPVGVFVNECADRVIECCREMSINRVQLHEMATQVMPLLDAQLDLFLVIPALSSIIPELPENSFHLFDSGHPGLGHAFDWDAFVPPKDRPWILAGGLAPNNVRSAITRLKPYGVDVSSGVESTTDLRKDIELIKLFINEARREL